MSHASAARSIVVSALGLLGSFGPLACGGDGGATGGGAQQDASLAAGDGSSGDGGVLGASVLQRSNGPRRAAMFVEPTLDKTAAMTMAIDPTFDATFAGHVFGAPLYVENGPGGKGAFVIADEGNTVRLFDETTGASLWSKRLGAPATTSGAGCGNISPIGITGTPAIDLASRTIFASAAIGSGGANDVIKTHEIHAVSLDDGSERAGFPIDVSRFTANGVAFDASPQNQRSALLLDNGVLYVAYGGHAGDCGTYHGWLIAVPIANPGAASAYATPAGAAGMWNPGGPSSDGTSVYMTTGNAIGSNGWQAQEAILRFDARGKFSGQTKDYFVPSNWQALDQGDIDVGGTGPLVVDVAGATPSALVAALGKNGVAYLADRANLGGFGTGDGTTGEGVASAKVMTGEIINVAATYTTPSGTYVVMHGHNSAVGADCPAGQSGDLVAIKIGAGTPPTITTAWCRDNQGAGSPIVTTTDGRSNAIVWSVGADLPSGHLHAWDGETGQPIYMGGDAGDGMKGVRRFTSPIAVHGAIVVGADDRLYKLKAR